LNYENIFYLHYFGTGKINVEDIILKKVFDMTLKFFQFYFFKNIFFKVMFSENNKHCA